MRLAWGAHEQVAVGRVLADGDARAKLRHRHRPGRRDPSKCRPRGEPEDVYHARSLPPAMGSVARADKAEVAEDGGAAADALAGDVVDGRTLGSWHERERLTLRLSLPGARPITRQSVRRFEGRATDRHDAFGKPLVAQWV